MKQEQIVIDTYDPEGKETEGTECELEIEEY